MKSPGNNNNESPKRLREFLNSPLSDAAGDFEKDAREGFDLLGDDEEAIRIKGSLDRRMHTEVIGTKKGGRVMYRLAIAAMLVITLLSIYFIADSDPIPDQKNIAVNDPPQTVIRQNEIPPEPVATFNKPEITQKRKEKPVATQDLADETGGQKEEVAVQEKEQMGITTGQEIAASGAGVAPEIKQETTPPAAAPEMDNNFQVKMSEPDNAGISKKRSAAAADAAVVPAGRSESLPAMPEAAYDGGDQAIIRDLKKLLAEKKLDGKFDATVYVNENGKVEDADITNAYELKGNEKILEEILMKLQGFKVVPHTQTPLRVSYKIRFRP
jgi:hypothetical protein